MKIGICGLGYVGLPLALPFAKMGVEVIGLDVDEKKINAINRGESYIAHIEGSSIRELVEAGRFRASLDFSEVRRLDAILICVPTPLTIHREPDLSYVLKTGESIAPHLQRGALVVLESTTYPGTTVQELLPVLERGSGLKAGTDFHLAFSPEREDPGHAHSKLSEIPKVVGGLTPACLQRACALYENVVKRVVPVSSCDVAEAVKLTENIFRSINIALVNELKVIYAAMGIDIWEVIEAAKTKPFGYMPFYPGPGLGGHCIPIDPFYLTWKSREYDLSTRFIELAGEINSGMPRHVVTRLAEALDRRLGRALSRSRVLVIGLAYKKNVPDIRESPSLKLIELIEERGGQAAYHDPHVPTIPKTRAYGALMGRASVPLTEDIVRGFDAVLVSTDHDGIDWAALARWSPLIIDTRNVFARNGMTDDHIVKA